MKKTSKKRKTYFGQDPEKEHSKNKKQSEFSSELIYSILEKTPHPLRLDDILRRAEVSRRSKKEVLSLLHELVEKGKITRQRGGTYSVSASLSHLKGRLAVQRSGAAFVTVSKEEFPQIKEDIYIPEHNLGDAWNGDIVEVILMPRPKANAHGIFNKRREGKVTRILERTHTALTVRLEEDANKQQLKHIKHLAEHAYLAKPTDSRFNFTVLIPLTEKFLQEITAENNQILKNGDLLEVRIENRLPSSLDTPLWLAFPQKFLGGQNKVSVQESITKISNNIPTEFPDDVLNEAENIALAEGFLKTEQERRTLRIPLEEGDTDLRDICLVTIDGEDSRDFDDAVFVEKTDQGYNLIVAIADVSRYVTPYSKLDKEAKHRGNSYYFPHSVEPMLPETLSNGLCSLRPNEEHRVMFAKISFGVRGQIKNTEFGQGVMKSKARLTYNAVQELYDAGRNNALVPAIAEEVGAMLFEAKELAEILIKKRHKAGSLNLEIPEQQCVIENDTMIALEKRPHFFAHELIEAFMVSANEAVAEFLHKKKAACLYRVHPAPAPERMQNLSVIFGQTSLAEILPAETPDKIGESAWLSQILNSLSSIRKIAGKNTDGHNAELENPKQNVADDTDEHTHLASIAKNNYLAHRMILRAMMQARYSPFSDIHFGLASKCYCHFTSPIRRYADLMVHRSLKAELGLFDKNHSIFNPEYLENIADSCNEQERAAQTAEREVFRRLSCLMLEKSIGKTFKAVISGLSNFGVFAEMQENMAEGMIRMEKLGDDYFVYDETKQILYGERTGTEYRLGDEIDVQIEFVDITRLEIDLILMGVTPRKAKGRSTLFRNNKNENKNRQAKKYKSEKYQSKKTKSQRATNGKNAKNSKQNPKERRSKNKKGK